MRVVEDTAGYNFLRDIYNSMFYYALREHAQKKKKAIVVVDFR